MIINPACFPFEKFSGFLVIIWGLTHKLIQNGGYVYIQGRKRLKTRKDPTTIKLERFNEEVSGAESRPLQPYDDKCSNQEGVKVGRPTPYIGAPSDVNFIFFSQ